MKIGVAIATLNDGPHLDATVACLRAGRRKPDFIVAVDDCGVHPPSPIDGVEILRNDFPQGSGPAKHRGVERCLELGASFIVVLDGHTRPTYDLLSILAAEHVKNPRAVLCPISTGIESNPGHHGMGAKLVMGEDGFWKPEWSPERRGEFHSYVVPCPMGGCYAMGADLLAAVGGYAPALTGYGVEEEYLALRAWITGHECKVVPRAECPHFYRPDDDKGDRSRAQPSPWGPDARSMSINRHVAAIVCFEENVYERNYRPKLPFVDFTSLSAAIEDARSIVQANRKVRDRDLQKLCGVVHP